MFPRPVTVFLSYPRPPSAHLEQKSKKSSQANIFQGAIKELDILPSDSTVIKKKVKLIPMDVLSSNPSHFAPYKNVTSLLPIPPMVKGITETIEEIKNTKRYSTTSKLMDKDFKIKRTQTNCANWTKAENPMDFQNTGRVAVKKVLFTNQNTTTLNGMAATINQ